MLFVLFDCESRIDRALLRRCCYPELPDTPDGEWQAYNFHVATLRERSNALPNEIPFSPVQWHVPISIATAIVDPDDWQLDNVETLLADQLPGSIVDYERDLVAAFWSRAEPFRQRKGVFVGFNSRGFDWPLLELAALKHGIAAPTHFNDRYGSRYRYGTEAHIDVLEMLTNYGAIKPPKGGLGFYLQLLGYQGKGAVKGSDVQALYDAGALEDIHRYCRQDVRRLYKLFLRVQVLRGQLPLEQAQELIAGLKEEPE